MNQNQFVGRWKQLVGKAKEYWGTLTDNLSLRVAGKHEQVVGRIQEQRGSMEEHAARQLSDFLYRNRNWKRY